MIRMKRRAKLVAWAVTAENVREARRRYVTEFNEEPPSEPTVHRWVQRFLEFGDINRRKEGKKRTPQDIMQSVADHNGGR